MDDIFVNTKDGLLIRVAPPKPQWSFSLTPDFHLRWNVLTAPNRFHRWMQRVFLGIHWRPTA